MIHTIEQAFEAARQILISNKIKHIEIGAPEPKAGFEYQNGAPVKDIWVVSLPRYHPTVVEPDTAECPLIVFFIKSPRFLPNGKSFRLPGTNLCLIN